MNALLAGRTTSERPSGANQGGACLGGLLLMPVCPPDPVLPRHAGVMCQPHPDRFREVSDAPIK